MNRAKKTAILRSLNNNGMEVRERNRITDARGLTGKGVRKALKAAAMLTLIDEEIDAQEASTGLAEDVSGK